MVRARWTNIETAAAENGKNMENKVDWGCQRFETGESPKRRAKAGRLNVEHGVSDESGADEQGEEKHPVSKVVVEPDAVVFQRRLQLPKKGEVR